MCTFATASTACSMSQQIRRGLVLPASFELANLWQVPATCNLQAVKASFSSPSVMTVFFVVCRFGYDPEAPQHGHSRATAADRPREGGAGPGSHNGMDRSATIHRRYSLVSAKFLDVAADIVDDLLK